MKDIFWLAANFCIGYCIGQEFMSRNYLIAILLIIAWVSYIFSSIFTLNNVTKKIKDKLNGNAY